MIKVVLVCGLGMTYGGRHQIKTITNHLAVYVKKRERYTLPFPALRVELTTEKNGIKGGD